MDLTGRRILVTGASRGIGRATALLAARLGARVVLSARDAERLRALAADVAADGMTAEAAPFDMADPDGIPGWIRGLAEDGGPFHGVAHAAGIQTTRPVRSVDRAFVDSIMTVNLTSAFALVRGMRQRGCHAPDASMVFIASSSAVGGTPGNAVYAASKGALLSMVRSVALEVLRDGIRVNCVLPALVETDMADRFRATITADHYESIARAHPMGLGRPEDVANAIAFLLADTARWITGTSLVVDGGFLA